MPQINGIELCQAVRTDPDWQGLPILFLTARCDRETIQQVFAARVNTFCRCCCACTTEIAPCDAKGANLSKIFLSVDKICLAITSRCWAAGNCA